MMGCRRLLAYLMICAALAAQSDFDAIVARADSARDAGQTDKAVDLYQQALRLKPDWKQGWWVLGSILYDANRYQDGTDAFLPLTVLDPDNPAGWAMAGLCEFETKHFKESLAHLQKAAQLKLPDSLYDVAEYHLELILIRAGEFDSALSLLSQDAISQYAARGAENPKLVEAMGIAALRRPVLPEDIPSADRELVLSVGKALCDAATSHGKEATVELAAVLSKYPRTAQMHYLDGLILLQSDPDKALAEFQQELVLSPKHVQAMINIASEYVKRTDYKSALPYAERAVQADPRYFAAHAMLGKVLVQGDLDSARGIAELETAVSMAPGNPQSRLALASAYVKAGRNEDAAKQRAEFLRLRTQIDSSVAVPK